MKTSKKLQKYRVLLGFGIGLGSMAIAAPAHASVPTRGCSDVAPAASVANFSTVQVSRELAFLRRLDLHENLGFGNNLVAATCTGTCNPNGSGSYAQEPGCSYTQSCGGKPKALQG
ncbi:MAG TPA: hypothetical protein VKY85_14075 [Candidatus Angelobacter sp.]|nr:hypothetical protein [Candidatus Angelobacter sp.]